MEVSPTCPEKENFFEKALESEVPSKGKKKPRTIAPGAIKSLGAPSIETTRGKKTKTLQIRGLKLGDGGVIDCLASALLVKEKPAHFHEEGWRGKLCRFINDPILHHTMNFLLIVDMIIVVVSMQMEVYYLESQIEDFEIACHDGAHSLHHYGNTKLEKLEHQLEYVSIAILSFFALEIILAVIAEGKVFFSNPLHCLDVVVVTVSLYFELDGHDVSSGILVLVRSWRFLRIVHGVVEILEEDSVTDESKDQEYT